MTCPLAGATQPTAMSLGQPPTGDHLRRKRDSSEPAPGEAAAAQALVGVVE